ncbi:MAG: hypothetical protein IJ597_03880, partial [Synergistaceae bacterium]|nr:hypothetical protein [Synergistaceae bacterium]
VALKDCMLNITAGDSPMNANGEAGIDAEKAVYGVTVNGDTITSNNNVKYTHNDSPNSNGEGGGGGGPGEGEGGDENPGEAPNGDGPGGDGSEPPSGEGPSSGTNPPAAPGA